MELKRYLPLATKLRQGNVFTSVCQEFCPQGVSVPACTTHDQGGFCPVGSLSRGVSVWGESLSKGVSVRDIPRQRPPYSNKRAVRILLEYILVHGINICSITMCNSQCGTMCNSQETIVAHIWQTR